MTHMRPTAILYAKPTHNVKRSIGAELEADITASLPNQDAPIQKVILTVGTTDTNAATLSKPITAEATDSSTTAPPTPTPTSWLPTTNGSNAKTKPNASLTPALLAKTMTA